MRGEQRNIVIESVDKSFAKITVINKKEEKMQKLKLALILMLTITVGALFVVLPGCAGVAEESAPAEPAEEESQEEVATEEVSEEAAQGDARYNLDEDTAYEIALGMGSWQDWWYNTPEIGQYTEEPPYKVGFITGWRGNPWQEVTIAEFFREVERSPLITEALHMDSAGDVNTQISDLGAMFTMWEEGELDGIIVDPLDPMALKDTIEKIYDAGCPIILFNNSADTIKYNCFISNDPWSFGVLSAEWLAEYMDYQGKILFFRGIKGYPIDNGRSGGALSVFEQYPDMELVIEYGEWSADVAKSKFMDMQAANPDFDAVYSVGGQMSLAIVDAMVELGLDPGEYPHASEDNNGFLQNCIEYDIPAYASAHPSICSAISVNIMEMLLQGYPVPKLYLYTTPGIPAEEFENYVRPDAPEGIFVFTPLDDDTLNEIIK
ncbi:MAG: substrate-binding domain-containing protein [Actinomycetota bacterium]